MQIFRDDARTRRSDEPVAYVVSDDDEVLTFEGASDDEVQAKLDDFLTWAS